MSKKMVDLICGALLCLGLVFLYFAVQRVYQVKNLQQTGEKSTAVVIENVLVQGKDGAKYQPVLEFPYENRMVQIASNLRSNPPTYKIGEKVPVIYEKNNPELAQIVNYWNLYLIYIVLMAFAGPMIAICGGYFLFKAGIF